MPVVISTTLRLYTHALQYDYRAVLEFSGNNLAGEERNLVQGKEKAKRYGVFALFREIERAFPLGAF